LLSGDHPFDDMFSFKFREDDSNERIEGMSFEVSVEEINQDDSSTSIVFDIRYENQTEVSIGTNRDEFLVKINENTFRGMMSSAF